MLNNQRVVLAKAWSIYPGFSPGLDQYLVGGFSPTPLKNDGVKVSWDDDIPKIWKVIKVMFQTTKQILNINVKGFGFSATPAFAMHVLESPKCVFTVEIIQLAHGLHTFWGKHGKRHQCHHGFGVIICYHHDHPPWGLRYLAVPVPLVPERGPTTCKWRIVSIRVSSQIWQIVRPNQSQLIPTDVKSQTLSKDAKGYLTANCY